MHLDLTPPRLLPWLVLAACAATRQGPIEVGAAHGIALDHQPGGAPALVFLHGWGCDRTHWREVVPAFAGTHEVLALDLAGHGASTAAHDPWTVPGLAEEVVAILEEADIDRAILVGHSLGGFVALAAAAGAPDRVIGVVGVDTLQDADYVFGVQEAEMIRARYELDFEGTMRNFINGMFPESGSKAARELVLASALRTRREPALALLGAMAELDARGLMAGAGVPVRCINSADGWIETNVAGNREVCDYDAVLMQGVGHWPMLDRPADFNAHLARLVAELDASAE